MTSAEERAIAVELAAELTKALGPVLPPEALSAKDGDVVREVFSRVFDAHGIVIEAVGARILSRLPKLLARAEFNRQRAMGKTTP
jgi:hypothetical protein